MVLDNWIATGKAWSWVPTSHLSRSFIKTDHRPKTKNYTVLRRRYRSKSLWPGLGNTFLNMTPKTQGTKENIRKLLFSFNHRVMSDCLQLRGPWHAGLPCSSPSPIVCLRSCPRQAHKLCVIKIKNVCVTNDIIKKAKRQPTEEKK